jgi:hypothetical protein
MSWAGMCPRNDESAGRAKPSDLPIQQPTKFESSVTRARWTMSGTISTACPTPCVPVRKPAICRVGRNGSSVCTRHFIAACPGAEQQRQCDRCEDRLFMRGALSPCRGWRSEQPAGCRACPFLLRCMNSQLGRGCRMGMSAFKESLGG